jgi:competence protein ComEA
MNETTPTPVTPVPQTPAPQTPVAEGIKEPLAFRTQLLLLGLLVTLAGLIVWRWHTDHNTRPTEYEHDIAHRVDLNRASRTELQNLPHVGPKLADNIVSHREANGQFNSVDELRSVYGVGNATFNKLYPWLAVDDDAPDDWERDVETLIRKPRGQTAPAAPKQKSNKVTDKVININKATIAELETLPNIGKVMAQRIIEERTKKPFTSVADLDRVSGIGPKRLEALKDLVTVAD